MVHDRKWTPCRMGWDDDDTKREALGSWTWASSQTGCFMKRVVYDIQYLAKIKVNNETKHIAATFGIPYCERNVIIT
jgi:hypothetical protein